MDQIFVNYRREGGAYAAALLDELLSEQFGEDRVFRASRSILAGSDFARSILSAVEGCSVMLVIIDAEWSGKFDIPENDASPTCDWVLREIEEAFKFGRLVIPVLLSGVGRLCARDLPESVAFLADLQYLRFDYRNIRKDSDYMVEQLIRACPDIAMIKDSDCQGSVLLRWIRRLSRSLGQGGEK
ncbi:toll/interleukin-1 receptor domain-containing protein [Streptomyces sp. NPDC101178]|uniref:toll/interleukin-1 receptor domain-containing protein n=1 Tax=Streptomyces sp. NPDC101178 TaxID=3366124 RepID=UPI0037F55CB2